MQTKSLILNGKDGYFPTSATLYAISHEIREKSISVNSFVNGKTTPLLFEIKHHQESTLLDFTNVAYYRILFFDEKKKIIESETITPKDGRPFCIETKAKYVFLTKKCENQIRSKETFEGFIWQSESTDVVLNFPEYYGKFPYIIIKHPGPSVYMQVPICFLVEGDNPLPDFPGPTIKITKDEYLDLETQKDKLLSLGKKIFDDIKQNRPNCRMCLAINESLGYYYEVDRDEPKQSDTVPVGGILLTHTREWIAQQACHFITS